MAIEAAVSVPNTGAKNVRTIELVVVSADGTQTTVEVQAVTLVDQNGQLISASTTELLSAVQELSEKFDALADVIAEALGCDLRQAQSKKGGRHFRFGKET